MSQQEFFLLTFYKFVDVANPVDVTREHRDFCRDIWLKGRIYISEEGISSTVSGNTGQCHAYKLYLDTSPYFNNIPDIDTKANKVQGHCFEKLICKYRKEVVALGHQVTSDQVHKSLKELSIDEFEQVVHQQSDDRIILDMRNNYEYKLGHFKGAIPSGTVNFREVEELMDEYKEQFAGKKVLMYCTGGIRCDKLSVMLNERGFDNVYALEWWVVKYTNLKNDWAWLGNLYTFDGRVSTHIGDSTTHTTIGECIYSDLKTDNCENCRHSPCNARIIAEPKQYKKHMGFCSAECAEQAKQDLLIKNCNRDPLDYKSLRRLIENDPTQKQSILTHAAKHLDKKLAKITFRHATSQKEEYIID